MRLALLVNDLATELPQFTTTHLAMEATALGNEVWYLTVGDMAYDPDDRIRAQARRVARSYRSAEQLLQQVRDSSSIERVTLEDFDVLLLRAEPSQELHERPWAATAGMVFGQLAARRDVLVLNDPLGLFAALNKLYLQELPSAVRPKTLITREVAEIRRFVKDLGGKAVLKPLQGSGGQNVFLVDSTAQNLNQIIEVELREGYVIVQEFLPAAEKGDVRLFVMNGLPLEHDGKFAAMTRKNPQGDVRSNMHVGGKASRAKVTGRQLEIVNMIRPKLLRDGMFLVGLDFAGEKLMEVNVFSPGGLYGISQLTKVNFPRLVVEAIQQKVGYRQMYGSSLSNAQLAVT